MQKNEYFAEAGKIPNEIAFLVEGIFRIVYFNNQGEEITKYFIDKNNFVVDIKSYSQHLPSSEYIQSITPSKIVVFSAKAMQELSMTIISWDAIISKITAKALSEKVDKISAMVPQDATERYLNFFTKFPNLANQIPLSYLASYLGITQSSLSRIRKNI